MTARTIQFAIDAGPGVAAPAPAWVECWPTARFDNGDAINLPWPASFTLDASGKGTCSLDDTPSDESWVWNIRVTVSGGAYSEQGTYLVDSDSTDYRSLTRSDPVPGSPDWGPTALAAFAARDAAEAARDETIVAVDGPSDWSGAVTLAQADSKSTYLLRTLTDDVTLTLDDGEDGVAYSCSLELAQDATGGRTLELVNVRSAYGVAPVVSSDANSVTIWRLEWNSTSWTVYVGAANLSIPQSWNV